MIRRNVIFVLVLVLLFNGLLTIRATEPSQTLEGGKRPVTFRLGDTPWVLTSARLFQDQPALFPLANFSPRIQTPAQANQYVADFFSTYKVGKSVLTSVPALQKSSNVDVVLGIEAKVRGASDSGSLLGTSPAAIGVGVQRRTPIYSDPRIRGGRVGRLAASGSYWVPARIDLDTMLSKFDASQIADIIIIKGPYSSQHGPGFSFMEVELLGAPRFDELTTREGSTRLDYNSNGEQWHGRQMLVGGDKDWGYRFGYSHRTGSDYTAGDGTKIPASYNSRTFDFTYGKDLSEGSSMEFTYIRLDQTDVEFPGMAFDMDFLVTDGFEGKYLATDHGWSDSLEVDLWHNNTRFRGDSLNPNKFLQFPLLQLFNYAGVTNVDSKSQGFKVASTWEKSDDREVTAGLDLRHVEQQLDEIASGRIGFNVFTDANSPVPHSDSINPGLFLEQVASKSDDLTIRSGGRIDFVSTNVLADPADLQNLGLATPQSSLADILGSDEFDQSFTLLMGYVSAQRQIDDERRLDISFGYAERAPSLTELYAAEPFMFLLQNGMNTVTGDPNLLKERRFQFDLGLSVERDRMRGKANTFFAWVNDYITFENIGVFNGPPAGEVEQVALKYVNTELAYLSGIEFYGEFDWQDNVTLFGSVSYTHGEDRTRNGEFATNPASGGNPSQQVAGLDRGEFSGITGNELEALPSIMPLESTLGIRLHSGGVLPKWGVELSTRLVDDQRRVAHSLLESSSPGFTVFNMSGYYRHKENVTFWAGAHNFTNRHYREHLDFRSPSGTSVYQPGSSFFVSMETTY